MRNYFLFSLIIFLCASCSSTAQDTKPTSNLVSSPATSTSTHTPIPSRNLTATADWAQFEITLAVMKTQVKQNASTLLESTRMSTPRPRAPSVTPDPYQLKMIEDGAMSYHLSPDGRWMTEEFQMDLKNPESYYLRVLSLENNTQWKLKNSDQLNKNLNDHYFFFLPFYWSKDGHYLYLTGHIFADGPVYFCSGFALRRLDLVSGQLSEIITGTPLHCYEFAFSPDEKRLIFIPQFRPPLQINIVSMKDGKTERIELDPKYSQAGDVAWSPSRDEIIFHACPEEYCEKKSLLMIDLETLTPKVLIESYKDIPAFSPGDYFPIINWQNEDTIFLELGQSRISFDIIDRNIKILPSVTPGK